MYTIMSEQSLNSLLAKFNDWHSIRSPTSTFVSGNGAMQNELNTIVLHLWALVSYSGELPALSLLLIFFN